jgi:hypothetical protein
MQVALWEWSVADGDRNAACGVTSSRDRAMDALSLALISGEGHALGVVAPVTLVDGAQSLLVYLHGAPSHQAEYDDGVIAWKKSDDATMNALCESARGRERPT